jgi:hypothetical protein
MISTTKSLATLCTLALAWLSSEALAQDQLMYRDGREAEVKVTEVSSTEVKFKRFDNLDGPIYSVSKADLFMIKYSNGQKETFQAVAPAPQSAPQPGGLTLTDPAVRAAAAEKEYQEYLAEKARKEREDKVAKYTRIVKKSKVPGIILTPLGFGMIGGGFGMWAYAISQQTVSSNPNEALGLAGMGVLTAGIPIGVAGAVLLGRYSGSKRRLKALETPTAQITPSFIHFSGHQGSGVGSASGVGATLSIRF